MLKGKTAVVTGSTSGIGLVEAPEPIDPTRIKPGDAVLVSGDLGRHGLTILAARHGLDLQPPLASDCAPLWPLVEQLLAEGVRVHCLRDLTRGGLASALHELATARGVEMRLEEEAIPIAPAVASGCALLGFDPLHLANEGRLVAVVDADDRERAEAVLSAGSGAWIGTVGEGAARVLLRTSFGSQRLLLPGSGDLLPRIC